jgi:hypothetical protein
MSVYPSRDTLSPAQAVHATVPGLSAKEPGSHFWQVAEPNAEDTVPGSHLVHPEAQRTSVQTHSRGGGDSLYDDGGDQRRHERKQTESISNTINSS